MIRCFHCLLLALSLATEALGQQDAARVVAELRARQNYHEAEEYAAGPWQDDLSDSTRAELAIQLALVYTEQALAASPELREAIWAKADGACVALVEGWPDNPRRVLVDVQRALVSLARGEQARHSRDIVPALEHLRLATRRLQDVADSVGRELIELRLRPPAGRSAEALTILELESLESHIGLQLARAQLQLGLCYPLGSSDRDDALLQASRRLTPLAQRTPADELTWNTRTELAACLRGLGQNELAKRAVDGWLREKPSAAVRKRLLAEPATSAPRAESFSHQGDGFSSAMEAAAAERAAGRPAEASDKYRKLALRNANHLRAAEAHRLAIVCIAEWLRESSPRDHSALAESYEQLLLEHLKNWPSQPSADEVRLWLAQLLAARRDWQEAVPLAQQVRTTSDRFPESVQLVVQCFEKQLQQLDRQSAQDEPRRAQLLVAATSHLQPIITGPQNRWPDTWSDSQREAAVALARLHVRFSAEGSPYAERLLAAVLRGRPNPPESVELQAWETRARALLIEALARDGNIAEAHAMVDQLANAPVDVLQDTLSAIDGMLHRIRVAGDDKRELGELLLSLVRLLDARRSALDAAAIAKLGAYRAAALAAIGDRPAALAQYAALAAQSPDDGSVQELYAELLSESDSTNERRESLKHWQQIESRSRRGGPRWRRARQARIDLQARLGEQADSDKLLQLTRLLYPDWDSTAESQ